MIEFITQHPYIAGFLVYVILQTIIDKDKSVRENIGLVALFTYWFVGFLLIMMFFRAIYGFTTFEY